MSPTKVSEHDPTQDPTYVIDTNLNLVEANDAWRDFATDNNGETLLREGARINVLEAMDGSQKARWEALYKALLRGDIARHTERLSCPSPTLRREYELTIEPRFSDSNEVAYLEHRLRLLSSKPAARLPGIHVPGPETPTSEPGVEKHAVSIQSKCLPLHGNGGDAVWTHHETDTRAWWLIADAMGHDERSNRAVQCVRALVAENLGGSPQSVVQKVNDRFIQAYRNDEGRMFVSGILCLIDMDLHKISIATFGHQGLLTTNMGAVKLEGGMPVGVLSDAGPWPEQVLDTRAIGKRGMVFTDGLFEQFNDTGEMYSIERLYQAFMETQDSSLAESMDRIFRSVERFRDGAPVKDDRTLLGFEFSG
ncbi:PP2C family protein-serine/threonine phosphatase [Marinobacter sp. CHS3-4]|uniref:PP2C family protein-serine/threonine phosphatase n=1 Tax=Marinobacter sp. CHS3-4 TaxID=3045174 RepID=UPI0024B5D707|nr:PP2C family protein-serine/threonine phosphatase [Marinobacter sp. CHS3-4]MDI9244740.1 PP2C family protein-serine/threonine phosphatase [Marinobacter sp. CHS3-4]